MLYWRLQKFWVFLANTKVIVDVCRKWRGRKRIPLRVNVRYKSYKQRRAKRNKLKIRLTCFAIKDVSYG